MKLITKIFSTIFVLFITNSIISQISVPSGGVTLNFNSYQGSLATIPAGVTVTSANFRGQNTGTNNAGGSYGYHPNNTSENSLGGLRSDSNPTIIYEISFINNSGQTITALDISYNFEQYRYANSSGITVSGGGQLSTANLSGLSQNGISTGTHGTVSVTPKSISLSSLNIANGATFSIAFSWTNDTGADNGLAVDDLVLSNIVLPIKLGNFDGRRVNGVNKLFWTTTQEINNSHFDVLHSTNGTNYTFVDRIEGNGNTSYNVDYSVDHNPAFGQLHYYQIRQFDYDGSSETFGPIYMKGDEANLSLRSTVVNNILEMINQKSISPYAIYNINGQLVKSGTAQNEINIISLAQGRYFLRIDNESFPFVVIR